MPFAHPVFDQFVSYHPEVLGARGIARFESAQCALHAASEAGVIKNTEYEETREVLNRTFEKVWRAAHADVSWDDLRAAYPSDRELNAARDVYWNAPQFHTYATALRRLEQAPISLPHRAELSAYLVEIGPIVQAMTHFTKNKATLVVKRQPRSADEAPSKYLAPLASGTAVRLVQDALVEVTTKAYDGLLAQIWAEYRGYVLYYTEEREKVLTLSPKARVTPYDIFIRRDPRLPKWSAERVVTAVTDERGALRQQSVALIETLARRDADAIRDQFIVKNLTKLDSIVDAKGDVASVTVISQNLGLCQLEGTLRVTFKDGARFDAKNSVVWTHSIHGKPFNRFPLTFHDVRFADGTKMPQPSEERMNTLFVGKVAL